MILGVVVALVIVVGVVVAVVVISSQVTVGLLVVTSVVAETTDGCLDETEPNAENHVQA